MNPIDPYNAVGNPNHPGVVGGPFVPSREQVEPAQLINPQVHLPPQSIPETGEDVPFDEMPNQDEEEEDDEDG